MSPRDTISRMMANQAKARVRYQSGTIRYRDGKVYGQWRGEPDASGKRPHYSRLLGEKSQFRTKKEAREALERKIAEYYDGLANAANPKPIVSAGMTLADFVVKVYRPAKERTWTKNTRVNNLSTLKCHVLAHLGTRPMASIVKADVEARINAMLAEGYGREAIKRVKWIIGNIFEEAIENNPELRNPVRRISLRGIAGGEETRPCTPDEVRTIWDRTSGLDRMYWRVLFLCGLRPGEVAALRRNDVGELLRVDENFARNEFKPTKTRTVRYQPIPQSLRPELADWLRSQVAPNANAFLFTIDGRPLTEKLRNKLELRTREAAGIADLELRMARTTYGTLLQGDIKDVQELLGHKRLDTTWVHYKKRIAERQVASVEELDAKLSRPRLAVVGGRKR